MTSIFIAASMPKIMRRKSSRPRLSREGVGVWTAGEHTRFLGAVELYPRGPWKLVAAYIGTRSTRQAMTHAQKYRQKLERRRRGLRNGSSKPKRPKPMNSTTSETEMVSLEQPRTADTVAAGDSLCFDPLPSASSYLDVLVEPTWVDDCFAFFIDNFSA